MRTLGENLALWKSPEREKFEREIQEGEERERMAPIRAAQAEQSRLLSEIREVETKTVLTGTDPEWRTPASLPRSMKKSDVFEYGTMEAKKLFALEEFKPFHTKENWNTICDYLG